MVQQVATGPRIYAVGEVVGGVRRLLEDRVGRIWIVGEVRGVSRPRSGHFYFTLADDAGQLRAALFRADARRVAFEPEDGLEVLAYGDLTVYEPRGDLQLIVRQLEPRGLGALQVAFEQLRLRLEAEGLFDPERKREPPELPTRIGVVTSPSGAALHDVLEVTGRRLPGVPILVAPTRVQGPGAEREIALALRALDARADVSVILLVRGGGSLEDLQAFNSEEVARAVVACRVPVIVGVGHEVDVTIADLAADLRAPTPSAAAELALPDRRALSRELRRTFAALADAAHDRLAASVARLARGSEALRARSPVARLRLQRQQLRQASRALRAVGRERLLHDRRRLAESAARLEARSPLARVRLQRQQLRQASRALRAMGRERLLRDRRRLAESVARLEALSPLAVLGRGYGLVRRARDGGIVREPGDVEPGELLEIRVDRARIEASVRSAREWKRS